MNTSIQRKELRTRLYTVESPFNEISFPAFFCLHYNNTFVNTVETVNEGKLLIHRDQRFAQTPILSVQENFETIHLILYIQYIEIMIHVLVCENKGRNLSETGQSNNWTASNSNSLSQESFLRCSERIVLV